MPDLMLPDEPRFDDLVPYADLGLDPAVEAAMVERLEARLSAPAAPAPRRRPWRPRTGRLRAGAALAWVVAVLAGGAVATAAVGLWDPPLGDDNGRPTRATTAVPADQVRLFGVLRRGAVARDRDAAVLRSLRFLRPSVEGVRTDGIRAPRGLAAGTLLVPVERWRPQDTRDALCLVVPQTAGNVAQCWTTAEVLAGEALLGDVAAPEGSDAPASPDAPVPSRPGLSGTTVGLVPDGVAAVEAAGRTVPVRDNAFALPIDGPGRPAVVWRAADGSEVPQG